MARLPTTTGTAGAVEPATQITASKREEIADALRRRIAALRALLGGPKLADRFCRAALAHWSSTANQSPKDRDRLEAVNAESYATACQAAALDRLTPDGRDGWIVVRGDGTATWSISWRGMVRRMRRAVRDDGGKVRHFCAEVVYREEIAAGAFDVDLASRTIRHRPWYCLLDANGDRLIPIEPLWDSVDLVYAAVTLVDADGEESREFRILTIAELNQRARMSGDPRDAEWSDAWQRWPRPQAKKSAVRALSDWLPLPDGLDDAAALPEADAPQPRVAAAVADRVRALEAATDHDAHTGEVKT